MFRSLPLAQVVASRIDAAKALWSELPQDRVRCHACAFECTLAPGTRGACKVRWNQDGALRVPWGYVGATQVEPIEKKPLYHVMPGASSLSIGMLGCNLRCGYCQNWKLSQAFRDPAAHTNPFPLDLPPLVDAAVERGVKVVVATFNEPLVNAEWCVELFRLTQQAGLVNVVATNGHANARVLRYLRPTVDALRIDLKAFSPSGYRALSGELAPVLATIEHAVSEGFWVEVATPLIPGFNDDLVEVRRMARFLASVSKDIPWHLVAFHPDYKMTNVPHTSRQRVAEVRQCAQAEGLHFVYSLNARQAGEQDTRCAHCREQLIARAAYEIRKNHLLHGLCHSCGTRIPGIWSADSARRLADADPGQGGK